MARNRRRRRFKIEDRLNFQSVHKHCGPPGRAGKRKEREGREGGERGRGERQGREGGERRRGEAGREGITCTHRGEPSLLSST
jgi:hypothetical protein